MAKKYAKASMGICMAQNTGKLLDCDLYKNKPCEPLRQFSVVGDCRDKAEKAYIGLASNPANMKGIVLNMENCITTTIKDNSFPGDSFYVDCVLPEGGSEINEIKCTFKRVGAKAYKQ